MKGILATIVFILVLSTVVYSIDFTPTATEIVVTYNEPTVNADGSAIADLAYTTTYYQIGTGTAVKVSPDVKASSVKGGGAVSTKATIPIGPGIEANVTVWATATDLSGNESTKSQSVTKRIDRLPPGPPN